MLLPNNVLVQKSKKSGAFPQKPYRSSIGGTGRHTIGKRPGEHCSLENTGSESTNTSSATGLVPIVLDPFFYIIFIN